ncbi:FAD-binding protein [Candidatus Bathyarchaeota archaeon]|nr:FAD-binding protein [Candidatus Bathyarchaeota archaeon]
MKSLRTDVLIIGSGAAGIRAAIEARRHGVNVLIVSKSPVGLANTTAISLGGLRGSFTATGEIGDPAIHFQETLSSGKFLNNQRLVQILATEGPGRILELRRFGIQIQIRPPTAFIVGRHFPAGITLTRKLLKNAREVGVKTLGNILVIELIKHGDAVLGALGIHLTTRNLLAIFSKATVLATGGAGAIYQQTDNPTGATGDGYALAYHVGARLIDMEFVQFLPVIAEAKIPPILITDWFVESIKHIDKNVLQNALGESILEHHGLLEETVLRDNLMIAMGKELYEGRGVAGSILLDLTNIPKAAWKTSDQLRYVQEMLIRSKINLGQKKLKLVPAAHFFMGGIKVHEDCCTGIPGLFAAGETAGGFHGANRLGGNALTQTLVSGARAGESAAQYSKTLDFPCTFSSLIGETVREIDIYLNRKIALDCEPRRIKEEIKIVMYKYVGAVRDGKGLNHALSILQQIRREKLPKTYARNPSQLRDIFELDNMLLTAEIVARSAMFRTESRGAHYRVDYPKQDDARWMKNIIVSKESDRMIVRCEPIVTLN